MNLCVPRILGPLLCLTTLTGVGHAAPPNFVIFYVDDLGWADTSVRMMDDELRSRSDFYQTPALERLAGEMKLFNVATDYREQHDLAERLPDRVKEMNRVLTEYVRKVDGGSMSAVYTAYFEWLDQNLQQKQARYRRQLVDLKRENPADFEKRRAALEADWQAARREHATKRAVCRDQMKNPSWRESTKQDVLKRLGVDAKGNPVRP